MKQGVITHARLMADQWVHVRHSVVMVTLTYRPGVSWSPGHISDYTHRLSQWLRRRGSDACYTWVMETTAAGVPHYHVLIWLTRGLWMPKADRRGWWTHGSTRTEVTRSAVGYIAKYASKGFEHDLPRRARISGSAGLDLAARRERAWWLLPAYARSAFDKSDHVIRAAGGGFISRVSGQFVASEWVLCAVGRGYVRLRPRGADFRGDVPVSDIVGGAGAGRINASIVAQPFSDLSPRHAGLGHDLADCNSRLSQARNCV